MTNTTPIQAASIDTPEFRKFFITCGGTLDRTEEGFGKIVSHIDAKLAQARHEAWCEGVNIDALREHNAELESRLAEIQRVAGDLKKWETAYGNDVYSAHEVDEVLALLQPQHQADESGLPG